MKEFTIICGGDSGEEWSTSTSFVAKLPKAFETTGKSLELTKAVIHVTWFNLVKATVSFKLKERWETKLIPDGLYSATTITLQLNALLPNDIIFESEGDIVHCKNEKLYALKFGKPLATLLKIKEEQNSGFTTHLQLPKFLYISANNLIESSIINNTIHPILAIIPIISATASDGNIVLSHNNDILPKKILTKEMENISIMLHNEIDQQMYFIKRCIMLHFRLI